MPADVSVKNDPLQPWTVAQILAGDVAALKTNDGWLVFRALETEVVSKHDENWPNLAGGAGAGPLRADGTTAGAIPDTPVTLNGEGSGREFLYVDAKNEIHQIFGSIDWPLARVYQQIPKAVRQGALRGELGEPGINATGASTWGWQWTGYQSLIGDARRVSMFLLPYSLYPGFAVFNEASMAHQLKFEWVINKVRYEALNPRDREDAKLIEAVLKARIDAIRWSPGLGGFNYAPGFRTIFQVDPVKLTKRQLMGVGTNGEYPLGGV